MKKLSVLLIIAFALFSFSVIQYEPKHSTGEANLNRGFYIFTDCTPVSAFDIIGEVKTKMHVSGTSQYSDVRDRLINQARKDFPTADGIIFEFITGKADHATVIKFK